jgi:hypothetical protein
MREFDDRERGERNGGKNCVPPVLGYMAILRPSIAHQRHIEKGEPMLSSSLNNVNAVTRRGREL